MSETARAIALGLRIGGIVLMLLGLYEWLGGSISGDYRHGTVLVVAGAIGVALAALVARRGRHRSRRP